VCFIPPLIWQTKHPELSIAVDDGPAATAIGLKRLAGLGLSARGMTCVTVIDLYSIKPIDAVTLRKRPTPRLRSRSRITISREGSATQCSTRSQCLPSRRHR
jgi:hypothetical protein